MGISAWSKSPRIVAAIYASIFLLGGIVAGIIANIVFRDKPEIRNVVQHLSLPGLIGGITQNIMHLVVPEAGYLMHRGEPAVTDPPKLWPLLTIAGVLVLGSLAAAWAKIRAVEVIRG
jgi:hypothetical protein